MASTIQVLENLFNACQLGNTQEMQRLLNRGSSIDCRSPEGWTPLIVAAFNGHQNLCRILLMRGADVNACNRKGTTVLMFAKSAAIRDGNLGILDLLLESGADASIRDDYGLSIFDYLNQLGEYKLIEYLNLKIASIGS